MFDTTNWLNSSTGARIAFHHQPATSDGRGVILVLHGLADHSRRYRRFAEAMATHGFHVYAPDHRGHGETTAPGIPIGRFALRDGASIVTADVKAVRDLAAKGHPGLPIILLGHSMGGLIALNAAIDYPQAFDGIAVWNSNFNPGLAGRGAQAILLVERALKGSDVPSTHLPKLTFGAWGKSIPGHRTDFDWLSHDQTEVDAYVADPLCGFDASVSLWLDIFEMSYRGPALLDRLPADLPVNLVGGTDDPATDGGRAIRWLADRFQKRGMHNVETIIYPQTRHETLNDRVRDRATNAFAEWAKTLTSRRSDPSRDTRTQTE
jgi:alpha-beta hydrolase superfamily lysophospholipase